MINNVAQESNNVNNANNVNKLNNNTIIHNNDEYVVEEIDFKDIKEGDYVYGINNDPVKVSGTSQTHVPDKMFKVIDDNGNELDVSGTHLWYIVTEFHRGVHHERKKRAKKTLAKLLKDKYVVSTLEDFADNVYKKDESIEITVVDMIALLFNNDKPDFNDPNVIETFHILNRIASSIGVTTEANVEYRDMAYVDEKEFQRINYYDARLFSQQVLALSGMRKYVKKYKILIGQVVTTERMFELLDNGIDVYIPD